VHASACWCAIKVGSPIVAIDESRWKRKRRRHPALHDCSRSRMSVLSIPLIRSSHRLAATLRPIFADWSAYIRQSTHRDRYQRRSCSCWLFRGWRPEAPWVWEVTFGFLRAARCRVSIGMWLLRIVLTCIISLLLFNHCICTFDFFYICELSFNRDFAHVDVRLTCLINNTYLLT